MKNLTASRRIPNLTSLRFILALLVVFYHIPLFSKNNGLPFFNDFAIFHKGAEAVYMFFSLSGFLIIKQLYDEKKQTHSIRLKRFYWRRILRIFPLYYLVLAFGFFYYHFIVQFFGFEFENNYDLLSGIVLAITFFPNIFRTYSPGGILEILWSIGIEEQFYLFIAPVLLVVPLKRVAWFLGLFTGSYFLIFFSEYLVFLEKYKMLFFYFSFGGLCAILLNHDMIHTLIKKSRLPILLLFSIYFTTPLFKHNFNAFFYQLLSFILFGLAIAALTIKPIKILQHKTLTYFGKISYGIYMYHAIVMQLVGFIYLKINPRLNCPKPIAIIFINLSILIMTIIVSHLSYKYYESYFLNKKQKMR